MGQLYAVKFQLADGVHLGGMGLSRRDHRLALHKAHNRHFRKVKVLEVKPVTRMEFEQMANEIRNAYPARIPLSEITGPDETIRVIDDPDLVTDVVGGVTPQPGDAVAAVAAAPVQKDPVELHSSEVKGAAEEPVKE